MKLEVSVQVFDPHQYPSCRALHTSLHRLDVKWGNAGGSCRSFSVDRGSPLQVLATEVEAVLETELNMHVHVRFVFKLRGGLPVSILPLHECVHNVLESGDSVSVVLDRKTDGKSNGMEGVSGEETGLVEAEDCRIPVTVLTGFLGAGKTTVLNHLLLEQKRERIAVIENEFGEVAIDKELLPDEASKINAAEQVVVLDNGCMCCSVRGDLLGAFQAIEAKMKEGNPIDSVLIETTGLANPVPIVRTITGTPFINRRFKVNGVATLVDTKNIESHFEVFKTLSNAEISTNEAFQQIMFADLVVLSKVDLVEPFQLLKVREEVRQINPRAPIIGCSMGKLNPIHVRSLQRKCDADLLQEDPKQQSHSNGHGHSHGHGHCNQNHSHSHSHSHGHAEGDCDRGCDHEEHESHVKDVVTFSIIKHGVTVDGLKLAWWMRRLATLKKEEEGELYRAKGIFPMAGTKQLVVFHAVQDLMDKSFMRSPSRSGSEQAPQPCKVVFIGRKLNEPFLREGFGNILLPYVRRPLRDQIDPHSSIEKLTSSARPLFDRVLLFLDSSADVAKIGMSCRLLYEAVFGNDALSGCRVLAADSSVRVIQQWQSKHINLHVLGFSMQYIRTYWEYMQKAQLDIVSMKGLSVRDARDAEACGVTWLEVCDLADEDTCNYVVDFTWREATLDEFFSNPDAGTTSALARIQYEAEDEFGDTEWDTIKFKLKLQPAREESEASTLEVYKLVIQSIGRSASQVYQLSFHSIHSDYQFHVKVPDHRMPIYETKERFHRYHAVLDALRRELKIRVLIRVKPDGSGPLGDMCGCC